MDCVRLRDTLVDLLGEQESTAFPEAVREHLESCAACRAQLDALRRAEAALRGSVAELAPADGYLTPARLQRLRRGIAASRRPKVITLRRVAGLAAAAAIVLSLGFLYLYAYRPPDDQQPGSRQRFVQVPGGGRAEGTPTVLVGLRSSAPEQRPSLVTSHAYGLRGEMPGGGREGELLRANSRGVRVPVHNVLYDPEEVANWW